jgi:cyanophycinase
VTGVLALVGGGEFTSTCAFDASLLAASGGDQILVLPTAAAFEHPERVGEAAARHAATLGATADTLPVLKRGDATDAANVATVRRARFIYLAGGSPMHMVSVLKQTPVWEAVEAAWHDGAVVAAAGEAAAAITDPMVDSRGGAFTIGLALLGPLAVMPRHETWSADRSRRTMVLAPKGCPVLALDSGSAAIRDPDGRWTAHGTVAVHLNGQPADINALP